MESLTPIYGLLAQGRANLIKDLLDGDLFAWAIVIGMLVIFGLALAVSNLYRRPVDAPSSADPAEIVALWKSSAVVRSRRPWSCESNLRFCPKCGAQLQETEPTQRNSAATSKRGASNDP